MSFGVERHFDDDGAFLRTHGPVIVLTDLPATAALTEEDASAILAGDLDGDGESDLLVGAVGVSGGRVYVVHGPLVGLVEMTSRAVFRIDGETGASIAAGETIVPLGDLDGDGTADFALTRLGSIGGFFLFNGPT